MVRPSAALARAAAAAALLVALALVLRRPDLVAVAAPFALGALVVRRPTTGPSVELSLDAERVGEDDVLDAVVRVSAPGPMGAVRVELEPGGLEGRELTKVIALEAGEVRDLHFELRATHWGRVRVGPARITAYSSADGFLAPTLECAPRLVRVVPAPGPLRGGEVAARALNLVGDHRSAVAGAGVEIVGVRPFRPGDRLRRVNWRATALHDELHVTTTRSERSALILLVLDTAYDAGGREGSALDATVRAATGLAEHFLRRGDAVGVVDTLEVPRRLAPRTGRRQIDAIGEFLLDARARRQSANWSDAAFVEWGVPSGALVVVLTPFLDVRSVELLLELRAAGRLVIAFDTLPSGVVPATADLVEEVASALYFLERESNVARLGELGVPVARLAEAGSLEQALAGLTRVAQAPRLSVR